MLLFIPICLLTACIPGETGDNDLTKNTYAQLVDWHVTGFWVINCPVAWIRITNYNHVPIKDIQLQYCTYDYYGQKLNEGHYTIEYTVPPHSVKNFAELYLGLVDLHSEKLSVKLESVSLSEGGH